MKTDRKTKSKAQPIVRTMWALRWFSKNGIGDPHPAKHGAWMICFSKAMAQARRVNTSQVITRVRVVILPNNKPSKTP